MTYSTRRRQFAVALGAVVAVVAAAGAALAASAFNDVTDNHPASAEITAAHQVGVFQGYGDGTFRPDGKLTRGQAELVIHRMLTWQGTDDDGNFEISRADAAVLAMSGLCGLDPDRIPACAAVAAASEEVQAAYERGFNDGLDAATPTGSTPPPVTAPPAPATAAEKCNAVGLFRTKSSEDFDGLWEITYGDLWDGSAYNDVRYVIQFVPPGPWGTGTFDSYVWSQDYAADLEDGWFVCTSYALKARRFIFRNLEGKIEDPPPSKLSARSLGGWAYHWFYLGPPDTVDVDVYSECWVTRTDPVTGEEYYEQPHEIVEQLYYYEQPLEYEEQPLGYEEHPLISSAFRSAIAGDRPDPDLWSAHPADCPTTATPVVCTPFNKRLCPPSGRWSRSNPAPLR